MERAPSPAAVGFALVLPLIFSRTEPTLSESKRESAPHIPDTFSAEN